MTDFVYLVYFVVHISRVSHPPHIIQVCGLQTFVNHEIHEVHENVLRRLAPQSSSDALNLHPWIMTDFVYLVYFVVTFHTLHFYTAKIKQSDNSLSHFHHLHLHLLKLHLPLNLLVLIAHLADIERKADEHHCPGESASI